jgi:type II secretory pathway pseudopilin PulG
VIIGVLASLAIPRFTEASAKAKIAESPRVLASYESAYLAATAELPPDRAMTISASDIIFEPPQDSKWFTYGVGVKLCSAVAKGNIGSFPKDGWLRTTYTSEKGGSFDHESNPAAVAKKMVPNFMP